ncbi:LysR substrate-binding domain-containing protein [Sphingobium sp. Sx8-8]|uniref:LysR substrate-binding domain-containing protein n=1 Tax=Sphingobium sp. Sx8-8 TaxID=2933617 RepID=UPI001F55ABE9|nr:LysR substrate-binding domain-containing protein [Sphingobium sp. Sx8-8]
MRDLNDYALYVEVVRCGNFAAAGRALRMPKSTVSRRIALLEERLGVRLIERSTRRFRVTEVGQSFYERCRAIVLDAEQAEAVVAEAKAEPHGLVRFSCPTGLLASLSDSLPIFLARYPKVRLQLLAVDRPVDLIGERIDVALRVRTDLVTDAALTMRTLGYSRRILVAAPHFSSPCTGSPVDRLAQLPTLSSSDDPGAIEWELTGPGGAAVRIRHEPRMTCGDFPALKTAAIAGMGIALLPDHICQPEMADGRLVHVFPEWQTSLGIVHVVFTTRRGLPPAVRAFIDHLAVNLRLVTDS